MENKIYPVKGKIIFLDVDGVIATPNQIKKYAQEHGKSCPPGLPQIDPICMEFLKRLVDEFDAKIVVSSAWRKLKHDMFDLIKICSVYGIPIVGKTASLPSGHRGEEIVDYMKRHAVSINDICILDDSIEHMEPFDKTYIARTDPFMGIDENSFEKAREILLR